MRIVLINEFSDENCPVTKLVYDLGKDLGHDSKTKIIQVNLRTKYRPGGTRWQRVLSLFAMHLMMPFVLFYQWLLTTGSSKRLCIVVTTLPPLIHWNVLAIAHIFRVRCVVWYQDAHPEIESRILRKKGAALFAAALEALDTKFFQLADHVVALDQAMFDLLEKKRHVKKDRLSIAAPWTAFIHPAKALRKPKDNGDVIRLIYAGNYGFAHDLTPFMNHLGALNVEEKKRVSVTGVGMNEGSRRLFEAGFQKAGIKVETLPRMETFRDLLQLFNDFDFGIVSLHADYAGIAAPSKAYTYISQGLPIVYIGPLRALPDLLIRDGYGITSDDFVEALKTSSFKQLPISNQLSPDPKPVSIARLRRAIYD